MRLFFSKTYHYVSVLNVYKPYVFIFFVETLYWRPVILFKTYYFPRESYYFLYNVIFR